LLSYTGHRTKLWRVRVNGGIERIALPECRQDVQCPLYDPRNNFFLLLPLRVRAHTRLHIGVLYMCCWLPMHTCIRDASRNRGSYSIPSYSNPTRLVLSMNMIPLVLVLTMLLHQRRMLQRRTSVGWLIPTLILRVLSWQAILRRRSCMCVVDHSLVHRPLNRLPPCMLLLGLRVGLGVGHDLYVLSVMDALGVLGGGGGQLLLLLCYELRVLCMMILPRESRLSV
jgi:hypothetical protein